jgi:ATP-binding cassette subfamily B protein
MEETIQKDSQKVLLKTVWRTVVFAFKREPLTFGFVILFSVISAIITLIQLVSFSSIINEIIKIKNEGTGITQDLISQSIVLGLSFFIPAIIGNLRSFLDTVLRTRLGTKINLHLIDVYSGFDIGTIESSEFQKKRDRANKWGTGSINNVVFWISRVIRGVIAIIATGIVLYGIHPYLVALAFLGALPYYFIEEIYGKKLFNLTWAFTDESRIENNRMEYFKDPKKMVEVFLFKLKNLFKNQVIDVTTSFDNKVIKLSRKEIVATFFADIFETVCLMVVVAFVTFETINGNFLIGSLFLAFSAYRSFLSNTQGFFNDYTKMIEQSRYVKYWFDIFDIKPKLINKENALKPTWNTPPVIEFKNVSFAYPETDKNVLKNISFKINAGEKLAIVGENGAGKTTTVKLICRVYDPTEGEILVGGVNLKDIDIAHWRDYLGVLFQDFTNYNLTARESIAISRPNDPIDDEKVKESAEMVGADSFINELPKKYDQLIWKGFQDGVELSKGQHQRMAVARIFYRDALISILDEPTSAIDAVAEEKIFEVLEKKMEGKTVILISHRFSTVKNADQIAVIEHGELKELGSHKELMAKKGRYEELYTMQASRYLENE